MDSGYGITRGNLLRALPEALAGDANVAALASAIAGALAAFPGDMERLVVYARVGGLPGPLLDILAYDFKVDWWDADYTLEEKRRTLEGSWGVHRALGTKAAVEAAISAVYPGTEVREWFEYGGEPYSFKLLVDATYEAVTPEKHKRVLDRVEYYKNLRSKPMAVEYAAIPKGECAAYAGVAAAGMDIKMTAEVHSYGLG